MRSEVVRQTVQAYGILSHSLNRDGCEIRRLLTPETASPYFSHQTANNTLVESAKRLVRRKVRPSGTTLRRIDAVGFGLSKALRNLVGDSCLKLFVELVDCRLAAEAVAALRIDGHFSRVTSISSVAVSAARYGVRFLAIWMRGFTLARRMARMWRD